MPYCCGQLSRVCQPMGKPNLISDVRVLVPLKKTWQFPRGRHLKSWKSRRSIQLTGGKQIVYLQSLHIPHSWFQEGFATFHTHSAS